MSQITGNEPSQPFFEYNENGYGESVVFVSPDGSKQIIPYKSGLTIRQHFASILTAAYIQRGETEDDAVNSGVSAAQKLIAELNK